ncbi:hypothetical protein E1A91_A06G206500v1 [Gossypium mustelinum]|uniref:Uncharacterized protein n=1 Tax=Gossypium mustelinum TaxID=34275 RepID=A0A5D2YYD5_GOSMU|nr:hypothetical protein E1A91_A06G206500v1 [Gossypium mustelinum]
MARPIVINARGSPPHLSATCSVSFQIFGWLLSVSSPILTWNNSQACSGSRHSTLILFLASISPHTSKDRAVKISLEPFSWLGFGIPTFFKSTLSHKLSNNTTLFNGGFQVVFLSIL